MRKLLVITAIALCTFLISIGMVYAQEASAAVASLKQELGSDRQQIKEDLREREENAQAAKTEEEKLKDQIKAALDAGDIITAKQLKDRLMLIHQDNIQEKIEDKKELQADVRELKSDIKDARQEGYLPPRIDKDNNPPGPKGGPGASPNRKVDR